MKKSSQKHHIPFVVLMLVIAMLPMLLIALGIQGENVRRVPLQQKPGLFKNGTVNESFITDLERYISDSNPLKGLSIRILSSFDQAVLNDLPCEEAVAGKDDFIFFGETMPDQVGVDQLDDEKIGSVVDYVLSIEELCHEKGKAFYFVVAPDKGTIYPEMLPERLIKTDAPRSIDLLTDAFGKAGSSCYIDSKDLLTGVKQNGGLCYYKRDSHWNEFGACCIYNAAASASGLERFDEDSYSIAKDREGDLERFAARLDREYDERYVYPVRRDYESEKPIDLDNSKINITSSDANELTVLIWHDSFGKALQPFFSQNAGRLVMLRSFPYDMSSIDEYSPDIIIIEIAERKLPKLYELAKAAGF